MRRGVLAVAGTAVIAAASLGATATAYAKKGDDTRNDVRNSVACGTGELKLKAKTEGGNRLELEAEVDSNVAGQDWTVTLSSNGKPVWTGKRTTAGLSGSFSVETTIDADATEPTPTASPATSTTTGSSTSTTTGSSSDATTTTASPASSADSPSSPTASPTTTDDKGGDDKATEDKARDDKATEDKAGDDRAAEDKAGEHKAGDDKGGVSKPGNGKHVIRVTATFASLTCATEVTI